MISSRRHVYLLFTVAIIGSLLYFYFDPSYAHFFPRCIFHSLTTLYCPGCGSQRAMHDLLHGRIGEAADHNLLLVMSLPIVSFSGLAVTNNIFRKKKMGQQIFYSQKFVWSVFALVMLFFVLRNIPAWPFSFLAP